MIGGESRLGSVIRNRKAALGALLALAYAAWAYPFIMESSVVAFDGRRYFNLFDDAMISMRYAWNFSHGQGLVWNPGERVEGYTNLLQTLIMSVFTALLDKSTAVLAVQVLGVLLVLGCVYLVWRLCTSLAIEVEPEGRTVFTAAIVLMTLTYYPLSYWSLSGMETGTLTSLIIAAVWMIERFRQKGRSLDLYLAAGLLGLADLSRPDALIFAVPLLAYAADTALRRAKDGPGNEARRGVVRTLLIAVGIYLLLPLGQEAFRIQYYHALLPNTYYLKATGMPLADRIRNGLGFLSLYFWTHAIFLGMGLLGFVLKPDRRKACYLALVIAPILYEIWAGGAPLRLWRLMTPVEPLGAALFVMGGMELLRRLRTDFSTRTGIAWMGVLTGIAIMSVNLFFLPQIFFLQTWFPTGFYSLRVNSAVALNELTTQNASVGVLAAGVVPYYTGREAFDYLGRSDPHIASLPPDLSGAVSWNGMYSVPGHNKYDLVYSIEQLQPTFTDTDRWGRENLSAWVSAHYVSVQYHGVGLLLKRGAPEVKWNLINP